MRYNVARARSAGRGAVRVVELPATGHLIDLPHSPHCAAARHPLTPASLTVQFGGKTQQHCLAQFTAWRILTQFFSDNLHS